jgi:signal transduction histidine kinase
MTPWHLRLHNRIVIPFVLVAVVAAAAAALLTLLVISRSFEARVTEQILNTADVLSRGGFAENPAIVRSVKAITGADVVTFTDGGTILASTLEGTHLGDLAVVTSAAAIGAATDARSAPVVREVKCDTPCLVAYQRLTGRADARVAVIVEASEVSAATRAVARTMVLIATAGLVVMIAASQMVARRVTAPIERLVVFADAVAGGESPGRAAEGNDEIGRLGRSFNHMIDRLDRSQASVVRNEKLALAGILAARVAHDIRNPLSAIKMQTQLLQGQLHGRESHEKLLSAVLHDIATVEAVIGDLIELSRPGELVMRPSSLNAVVDELLQRVEPQMTYRKIVIESRLSPDLPNLALDPGRFKQAVTNVVVNAAEAMPSGGRVTITTRVAADRSTVVLEVCDDGIGIDPAVRERVFDPFVSSKPDGVGLGLVNAKAVVEQHGGRIELGPREPRGTRVRITLPVQRG